MVPIVPKPVNPVIPNAPGRVPEIAPEPAPAPKPEPKPEPAPAPKPADPQPATPACKRTGDDCASDGIYTFSDVNYPKKGRILQQKLKDVVGKNKAESHDYSKALEKYHIKDTKNTGPQVDKEVKPFFKDNGIDMGNVLDRDTSFTRYEVYGTTDEDKLAKGRLSVADVFISVKHKAMIPTRLFRNNDKLYDFPVSERLPMSEILVHLWMKAVKEGKAEYNVDISAGDLEKIIGMEVKNADTKAIVSKAQQEVGGNKDTFTVRPQDEAAFSAFAASSSGVSKFHMLIDHNGALELKDLQPTKIDVTTREQLPIIIWTLGRP